MQASPAGGIAGIIQDPSGAAVSNARITAVRASTGEQRVALSGANGEYRLAQLSPGTWSLTVTADHFKTARLAETIVQVDEIAHADFTLEIGDVSEVIEVSSTAPLIERDRSTLNSVVDARSIQSVPLDGRQFLDLALLTPGIVPAAPGTQGNGFSAAGARSQSNVYLLDGISNQDTQTNQPLNLFRISDAVQEFAVQTSVPLPEFGRGAGGQVNIVTKSGSSQFHGSAFEYVRNTVFDAADFFTNKLGGSKAVLNRNEFGGTLGGPLGGGPLIDQRTFFFVSYEGFRQSAPTVSAALVPSEAQRATVTDPISQRLLAYWPLPNAAGTLNYIANVRNQNSDDTGLVRGDRRLGEHDQLSARWTEYWGWSFAPGPTPLTGGNQGPFSQVSAMLNEVHTFTTSLLHEVRLGYSRDSEYRSTQDSGLDASAIFTGPGGVPIPGVVQAATDPLNSGLPMITVGGGFAVLGTNMNFPQGRASNTTEWFDNLSWQRPLGSARHSWRWGFHIRREDLGRYLDRAERGTATFQTFADFAKGTLMTSTFRTGSTQAYWRRYPWDLYWQDEFRVRPDLTLDFGVRYEYPGAAAELQHHASNFVPGYGPMVVGTNQVLTINPAAVGPSALVFQTAPFTLPASGVHADTNNVAPMSGFAWAPRGGRTVLRGGFRVAYDDLFNNVPSAMALNAPYNLQTTQTANVTQPAKFPWALAFNQDVPLISNYQKQGPGTPTVGLLTFQGIDPDLKSAYAYLYHFGIQRQLGGWLSLEADYQGSSGHRLGMFIDLNQPQVIVRDPTKRGPVAPNEQVYPYSEFGQSQDARSIGSSNYNGMVLTAKYRRVRGVFLQAAYTLGKSLDYNSSYFGSGNLPGEPGAPIDATNLRIEHGPSAFDIRQRFVLLYVIDLPSPRFGRMALGGWKLSGVTTLQTGTPFTVTTGGPDTSGFNQTNPGISPDGGNRPNLVKPGPVPQNSRNPDAAFDTSWFAANLAGQDGTSGRNQYHGPGLQNYDVALVKSFPVNERARFEFRGDFFNLFNHTNFSNPIADMSNANFGRITQTLGSAATTSIGTTGGAVGGPRLIQLSLRLQF